MSKLRIAKCPYCGKKLNPFLSWSIKNKGEYKCKKCGEISNIFLDSAIPIFAIGAILLSALMFAIFKLLVGEINIIGVIMVILPFFVFFFLSAFFVRLRKIQRKAPPQKNANRMGKNNYSNEKEKFYTKKIYPTK